MSTDTRTEPAPVLRVLACEVTLDGRAAPAPAVLNLSYGDTVEVGREAQLTLGADDQGISRVAVSVQVNEDRWRIELGNRNGAMMHNWARPNELLEYGNVRTLRWPRIGIRLVGNDQNTQHWVLLEADAFSPGAADPAASHTQQTVVVRRPRLITANQMAAVYATFPDHLAWPPIVAPTARSLEAVAARLGVSPSAVRERLRPVQERARELGLQGHIGVTEPDYVHHLAAYGYFAEVPPPLHI